MGMDKFCPRLYYKQETISLEEAIIRSARRKMRPVWKHYFSGNGAARDLEDFDLGQQFRNHPSVREAVRGFQLALATNAALESTRRCRNNRRDDIKAIGFSFTHHDTGKYNVNSDLDLTLAGRGTLNCIAEVNVEINCTQQLFSLQARLTMSLVDSFVDVRDLKSNKPGNQDIPLGDGFPLRHRWREPFEIRSATI